MEREKGTRQVPKIVIGVGGSRSALGMLEVGELRSVFIPIPQHPPAVVTSLLPGSKSLPAPFAGTGELCQSRVQHAPGTGAVCPLFLVNL